MNCFTLSVLNLLSQLHFRGSRVHNDLPVLACVKTKGSFLICIPGAGLTLVTAQHIMIVCDVVPLKVFIHNIFLLLDVCHITNILRLSLGTGQPSTICVERVVKCHSKNKS